MTAPIKLGEIQPPFTALNAAEVDRQVLRFRRLLAELRRIPAHRREDECADVRLESIMSMLKDLRDAAPAEKQGKIDRLLADQR
jgi:hypothetical protein